MCACVDPPPLARSWSTDPTCILFAKLIEHVQSTAHDADLRAPLRALCTPPRLSTLPEAEADAIRPLLHNLSSTKSSPSIAMAPARSLAFLSSTISPIFQSARASICIPHSFSRTTFAHASNTTKRARTCVTSTATPSSSTSSSSTTEPLIPKTAISPSPSPTTNVLPTNPNILTFQEAIQRLSAYWASKGCIIWHPYNVEVGAGTMNPATFLRVLGPEPWSVAYDEPSIRPDDSRYGENPNRLQRHTQFQVIVKPTPECAQELVVGSYQALGIDTCKNDIRFVEDNWESPALGAWGLGWEIWLNGMEVTQFTYFQQAGGITLDSVAVEITYGLERIIMALQGKSHFKDIIFAPGITYGDIFMQNEIEMSQYNMNQADIDSNKQMFQLYEAEALALLDKRLPVPAYNYVLKASHTFNILDARGAIGVTERARYFQRMRALSRDVARLWLARREELEFPLLPKSDGQSSVKTPTPEVTVLDADSVSALKKTADFVLEIGVEELPAGDVAEIIGQVETLLRDVLQEARLSYSSLSVDGTPRRTVAYVKDLQTRQADETKRVRGPPLGIAVKDGEMTKAALGFMRSQGVSKDAVELNETEGYMYATVEQKGRCTEQVLAEMIPSSVLGKINFGKSMRWNDTGVTFSRPLRWLVCLFEDHIVPVTYAGILSSNVTRSLRGPDGFATDVHVPSAAECFKTLEKCQIVLSRDERRQKIQSEAHMLASEAGGTVSDEYLNNDLMEEIVDLVENPIPLMGSFEEEFLDLPKEVLETVMKKHQRYLPVVHSQDPSRLINKFITVVNGNSDQVDLDLIRRGNEDVLRARYSDAAFFYGNDTDGKKLEDFVPALSGLAFQQKLGSMLDKKNRVAQSIDPLATLFKLSNDDKQDAISVANLFKADLATSMVIEMTSLAGTIGRHYACKSGEVPPQVCEGIFDANLPRFSGDWIAESRAGAVVAIADRMDSLVGLFSVGLIPKSTADPFALRRAALGVVQTLIANRLDVDVSALVKVTAETIIASDNDVKAIDPQVCDSVLDFVSKRLEGHLLDNVGFSDDVVKSAFGVPRNRSSPLAALAVCQALADALKNDRPFVRAAQEAHSRAARLLGSVKDLNLTELMNTPVDQELFGCDEERALWSALSEATKRFADCNDISIEEKVLLRMKSLVDSKKCIDAFFDGVFVNADDPSVRKNRLALCAKIVAVTHDHMDFSMLVNV